MMISIMFFKDFLKAMSVTSVYNYHPIVKHTLFTLYTSTIFCSCQALIIMMIEFINYNLKDQKKNETKHE